jgi:hypothetical protein
MEQQLSAWQLIFVIIMIAIQPHKQDDEPGEGVVCSLKGRQGNQVCQTKRMENPLKVEMLRTKAQRSQASLVTYPSLGNEETAMTNRKGCMLACEVSVQGQER